MRVRSEAGQYSSSVFASDHRVRPDGASASGRDIWPISLVFDPTDCDALHISRPASMLPWAQYDHLKKSINEIGLGAANKNKALGCLILC